ncbi:uncharacterized protein EAE98_007479 [Botrytis deweyae]|uniref:Histidine kinase n=1 Tax=Botrytis deweyae TaxID=2478750 RepID=A0ABQ7IHQ6_9HELO|nr:uncharacterized protein EAE98_007479 [Botrytis deweyae]KAF7924428.1 hypothetical protein EAE98_007479 [Botrytis deweyae]
MDRHTTLGAAREGGAKKSKRKNFDWISEPRTMELTPFQQFTVDVDWEKSPLGPMNGWSKQLRSMVLLCFADPTPATILWGDDSTIIYNEPFTQLIGDKHPASQGQNICIGFAEVWDYFDVLIEAQKETGKALIQNDVLLLLHRHGFEEETYMTYKFIPIICEDEGHVIAVRTTIDETTRQVIGYRRMAIIRALGEHLSKAQSIRDLWNHLIQGLELADKDAPFCLLYSVSESSEASSPLPSTVPCVFEGSVGIPEGHSIAPSGFDLACDQNWMTEPFNQAMNTMESVLVPMDPEMKQRLDGIQFRGFGEPTHVVICPITDSKAQNVLAFLVIALNPRVSYDKDYQEWIQILSKQVTTPQLSAIILRQEVERRLALAKQEALDREILSHQLTESEKNFARFATRIPVGLAILKTDGTALTANDLWRSQTKLEVGSLQVDWEKVLVAGEFGPVTRAWSDCVEEKKPLTFQTRIDKPWRAPELTTDGEEQWTETHLLLTLYPDLDDEGNVSTIMSCITDITELKWSENQLRAKMEQALEMRRQQERFIDMTSHEMRNPLSALIGCADEILSSLHEYEDSIKKFSGLEKVHESTSTEPPTHLISSAIEATDTIIYCAMHQKRIIDDILTLSRLDSNLLVVSPEPSQPVHIIHNALKMFESELKQADTKLNFVQHDSIGKLHVDWTLLDPSRVLQVLLNLMTNAIKFTRTEEVRRITVTMAASLERPSSQESIVEYVPKHQSSSDQTVKGEWGDGEVLYISITVTDSGRGLSESEKANLFNLFMQASPKTHVQYGGSGLGLFISRQLTEMQGGEIGVHSERGKGSTFQFYLKTRRTTPPLDLQASEDSMKKDLQMALRDDALREACGFEISSLSHEDTVHNVTDRMAVKKNDAKIPIRPLTMRRISSRLSPLTIKRSTKGNQDDGGEGEELPLEVLVVEDNLLNQKVLVKSLRKEGYGVNVANHGGEALEFLKETTFWVGDGGEEENSKQPLNLILMDLEMPIMDGITCVRQIRKWEAQGMIKGHVPIIAVTANARKDQIMSTIEAGMDDVTTKPYRIHDMLKQIETLVTRYPQTESETQNSNAETRTENPSRTTNLSNPHTHCAKCTNGNSSEKNVSKKSTTVSSRSPSKKNRTNGSSSDVTCNGDSDFPIP